MRKSNLKKKHHDYALEWHDDEKVYWINEETDSWKTEECYFDSQNGGFLVSLVNGDGLYISLIVPLIDIALAASKANLSFIIDKNIKQLKEVQEAFEKLRPE